MVKQVLFLMSVLFESASFITFVAWPVHLGLVSKKKF